MYRVILSLSASALALSLSIAPAKAVEVYLFKGAGDFSFINEKMHFSRGLEKIADALKEDGIHAVVRRHGNTAGAMREIKKRKPESVAFVGHSMGALASMSMAKRMKAMGIKVAYVGTLDIPGPIGVAGSNVEKAENYYSITPVYGLLTNARRHKDAKNIHVFGTHTTMDDSKKVFNGVVSAIRDIHASEQQIEPAQEQMLVDAQPVQDLNKVEVLTASEANKAQEEVTLVSTRKPIADLQTEESFAAVTPPSIARKIQPATANEGPINLLSRPIGGASPQAMERIVPDRTQKTASLQRQIAEPQRSKLGSEPVQKTKTSRLLDRVRSVLKRNGSKLRQRRQTIER